MQYPGSLTALARIRGAPTSPLTIVRRRTELRLWRWGAGRAAGLAPPAPATTLPTTGKERLQLEDAMRDHSVLVAVLDHILEGLQIIDPQWRYLHVNDAAARHGRTTKE